MFSTLIRGCDEVLGALPNPVDVEALGTCVETLHPLVTALRVTEDGLPFGRYLVHRDPAGLYNIQLDIFSPNYTGMIHNHDTWGCFWVLKGGLRVWDYLHQGGRFVLTRRGIFQGGSVGAFVHPDDWHQVGTFPTGPQTASIHIYGPGFDLDRGTYADREGHIQQGNRSPFKDLSTVLPALQFWGG